MGKATFFGEETEAFLKREKPDVCGELPYEKFLRCGAEALTDAELLAIFIRTGDAASAAKAKREGKNPAVYLAEEVLRLTAGGGHGGLAGLSSLSVQELMQVDGIGQVKATRICCVSELARRIAMAGREGAPVFTNPAQVSAYFRPAFAGEEGQVERSMLILLDGRGRLIQERLLSIGSVRATLVSPREIFLQAFRCRAVNFLLLHNHPSGDVSPSREDVALTKRVAELGKMMEMELLDHIILSGAGYYSFREAGLL